jgi:hypothetical protein
MEASVMGVAETGVRKAGVLKKVRRGVLVGPAAAALAAGLALPALAAPAHASGGTGTTSCVDAMGKAMDGTVTWSPTTLWPPDHTMQTITISYTDTDHDGDGLGVRVAAITDNQMTGGVEDVGAGEPHLADWSGVGNAGSGTDPGSATTTAQVRAERSGPDGSRVYSITVACSESGSETDSGTATLTVTVPHDQGHNG